MHSNTQYHTSKSCKRMELNEEALQLHVIYKKLYFFTKSHARIHISYYKSCAQHLNCNEIERSYDKLSLN